MKKASVIISVLVFSVLSLSINADTHGDLTYKIANSQVSITDCKTSFTGDLVIPDEIEGLPVTSIGSKAFQNCIYLTSVIIPQSVSSIGERSFEWCVALTTIAIPEGVSKIGDRAFQNCGRLTSISVPEAFYSESEANRLTLPKLWPDGFWLPSSPIDDLRYRISYIDGQEPQVIITDCDTSAEGHLVMPDKIDGFPVTGIGERAFRDCSNLTAITVPDSVTRIGDRAFLDCFGLESIVLPALFHSRQEANRIGGDATRELWFHGRYKIKSSNSQPLTTPVVQSSIRMASVITVQGEEGSVKTIEVADSSEGPWRFWMNVTATTSGVVITDLDGQADKRFYRVVD